MKVALFSKGVMVTFVLAALAFWAFPDTSQSSCGAAASSCKKCHEIKGEMKVESKGLHHTQHSFADFCVFCHGGSTTASAKEQAHEGMINPLADTKKSCSACHPDDFEKRSAGYRAAGK
jgi:hypothetical protein